jgi:MscS family membrane protein
MKSKLENLYIAVLAVMGALLVWTVCASAQTTATNVAAGITNQSSLENSHKSSMNLHQILDNTEPLTFGLDRIEVLQSVWLGNPLWKYAASLVYILLAFYVSKLIDWIVQVWLKRWTAKTKTNFDDLLLGLLHGPIKIISFVILLHIGLNLFIWPAWVNNYLSKGLQLVVAGSLTYVSLKFIDLLLGYWKIRTGKEEDKAFNEMIFPMVGKAFKAFVLIVSILVTSQNLGLNITSVLASLSIGGLALGLAAQDTVANLFGAAAVFMDKPFRIGDRIKLEGGVDGVVETIGLRSTRVRNLDGHLITVPNKTMGNATITNIAMRPTIKTEMVFGLSYDTSAENMRKALAILNEIYRSNPMTHDVSIAFTQFADSSLNIQVTHWWKNTDYAAYLMGIQEINLTIKKRFDAEGLNFAFPSRTLYVKQDSDWRVGTPGTANA